MYYTQLPNFETEVLKIIGICSGFLGIIYLFSDNLLITNANFFYALMNANILFDF